MIKPPDMKTQRIYHKGQDYMVHVDSLYFRLCMYKGFVINALMIDLLFSLCLCTERLTNGKRIIFINGNLKRLLMRIFNPKH